ncbi:acetolactate decarboxylase [Sphingomonas sp. TF3]|nr:acetolactate decarboxylase [Sphingomonas sp. TF3]RUN75985.1 acetolactate decarboxylase [Sphingomonas sp. TF3]
MTDSALGMIGAAAIAGGRAADAKSGELYQTSLMSALVEGVYEGLTTYGELHRHGDFGLGTFNDLDGEMVGFDGVFYQLRSDGSARPVTDDQKTPFAVVTFFKPERSLPVADIAKADLLDRLTALTEANLFTAIRVDGQFASVTTRTVREQHRPFPPLQDATKGQAETVLTNVAGTLAGFRTPTFAGTLGVPGFHLHFLTADRRSGGHVLDFQISDATAQTCTMHGLHIELPETDAFLGSNLDDSDLPQKIAAAEGEPTTSPSKPNGTLS